MQDHSAEATNLQNSTCVQATWPFSLIVSPRREWGTCGHGKGQSESSGSRPELGEAVRRAAGCSSIHWWGDPGRGRDGQHRTAARSGFSVGKSETA